MKNSSEKQKRRKEVIKKRHIEKQQEREYNNKNRVPATPHFLKMKGEIEEIEKTLASILGVDLAWFQAQRDKEKEEFDKAIMEYTDLQKWPTKKQKIYVKKINTLVEISGVFAKYAWVRFRFENIDNDFGVAETLKYDRVHKEIYIPRLKNAVTHILKEIKNKTKNLLKK